MICINTLIFKSIYYCLKYNRKMKDEQVVIEPEIIEFNNVEHQNFKIINKTSQRIDNCFFCLFNVGKYEFSP